MMMPIIDEDSNSMDSSKHNYMMSGHSNGGGGPNATATGGLTKAEIRKSNKPIMEKKRRARINHCLNELKTLILEAMKKDPARHTKLEKADILEMTVKHLQNIQRQQLILTAQSDSNILHKFKSGFLNCADEVTSYIGQMDGLDMAVRQRLANHLNNCVSNIQQQINVNGGGFGHFGAAHQHQHHHQPHNPFPLLSSAADLNNNNHSNSRVGGVGGGIQVNGVQLVPSRLPTGEIALIMPNSTNLSLNSLLSSSSNNNSQLNSSSPTPTFNPIVKSTPNNGTALLGPNVGGNGGGFLTSAYPRMSAFNPITSTKAGRQYASNLSSSPSLHANNSPPLSPVSSISSSLDLDSHPSMEPFSLNSGAVVVTTTPPLSSSGAANSSSSLNISSPHDVSTTGLFARHNHLQQQHQVVSSTTEHARQQQQKREEEGAAVIVTLPKKRSFAMMEQSYDQRSLSSSSPSDTTMEEHPNHGPSQKMPKVDVDDCAKDDMWRPW